MHYGVLSITIVTCMCVGQDLHHITTGQDIIGHTPAALTVVVVAVVDLVVQ